MNLNDLLRVSFRQIVRHRRRYWGVILAIILGIGGFITVIMMSRDFKRTLNKDLTLIGGVTVVKVYFDNQLTTRPLVFHPKTLAALRRLPGVQEASAVAYHGGHTTLGRGLRYHFPVMALDESFWEVRSFWPLSGRLFDRDAVAGRKRECVLGESLARKIFGRTNIAGLTLEINNEPYRITGVLGGIADAGLAGSAYLPSTTVEDRFPGLLLTDKIYIRCTTIDDVPRVVASIVGVVQAYQWTDQLQVDVLWEGLKRVQRLFWWTEFFIYIAIGVTLILGGVGICNVMMAAVRSRTREIGLRKAVGATDVDILKQFLAEALVLSLGASFLGILLGRVTVVCLSYFIDTHPTEHLFLICMGLGVVFGMFLGIGAGLFPSLQASRMEVVEAVRFE